MSRKKATGLPPVRGSAYVQHNGRSPDGRRLMMLWETRAKRHGITLDPS